MTLTEIATLAEKEFDAFYNNIHDDYPDLILKYKIDKNMKNEFIEAAVRHVWVGHEFNIDEILKYMSKIKEEN